MPTTPDSPPNSDPVAGSGLTFAYTSADEIRELLTTYAVDIRIDDSENGTVSAAEEAYLDRAVNVGSDRVNGYLSRRYSADQINASWSAHEYATVIAAIWVCRRAGRTVPDSLMEYWKELKEELEMIRDGEMNLGSAAEREGSQPTMSNIRIDQRFRTKQLRVERGISTPRPSTGYQQNRDLAADLPEPPL